MSVQTEILYPALRLAGVTSGPGRTASSEQLADAFASLNRLLSRWSTSRLNVFQIAISTFPTIASKQTYTIGLSGADVTAPRPLRIERANVLLNTSPTIRIQLNTIGFEDWAERAVQGIYTIPGYLYHDGASLLSTLYLYPIPDQAYTIELYTWVGLGPYATTADAVTLPEGYVDAIVTQLACRLATQFQLPARPDLIADAQMALAAIESKNSYSPKLKTEPGLIPRGVGGGGSTYLGGGGGALKVYTLSIAVTNGQTVFTTAGYSSATVYRNGLLQTPSVDYNSTTGQTTTYTFFVAFVSTDTVTVVHT